MELTWALGEVDNFEEANAIVTPDHIKPEWYFLFAYGVLRRVPRKAGGVVALLMRVLIIPFSVLLRKGIRRCRWSVMKKRVFWVWVGVWVILSWAGGKPVEEPFRDIGYWCGILYFVFWARVLV
jgi:ubiquinol-cytochrome c reductase cytochrome b subunit